MADYLTHKDIEPILSRNSHPRGCEEDALERRLPHAMAIAINFRETDDWDMIKGAFKRWSRNFSFGTGRDPGRSLGTQEAG